MSPLIRVLLIVALLVAVAFPMLALAQDVTQEPSPTVEVVLTATPSPTPVIVEPPPPNPIPDDPNDPPITTPETLLGQIFALLKDGTFIVWAAAGVVLFVGLIKTVAGSFGFEISGTGAVVLTVIVQVIVWLGYAIANYLNAGDAFQRGYLIVVDIARSLLPLFGAIFAGRLFYVQAVKHNVPIAGYRFVPKAQMKSEKPYPPQ
jgi:hypothetical protein